ncbi:hypothetical protein NL676_005123 [Syzygium grande]|nr:hypothetical protein NL676_005123 [Syzygium grande]
MKVDIDGSCSLGEEWGSGGKRVPGLPRMTYWWPATPGSLELLRPCRWRLVANRDRVQFSRVSPVLRPPVSGPTTDLHVSSSRQTVSGALNTVRQLVGCDLHAEDRGRRFWRNLGRLDSDGRPGLSSIHVTPDFGRAPRASLVEGTKVHVPVRVSPRGVASQGRLLSPAPGREGKGAHGSPNAPDRGQAPPRVLERINNSFAWRVHLAKREASRSRSAGGSFGIPPRVACFPGYAWGHPKPMASVGVRCGGGGGECSMSRRSRRFDVPSRQVDHQSPSKHCALTIPNGTRSKTRMRRGAVSASMPVLAPAPAPAGRRYGSIPRKPKPYQEFEDGTAIAHGKLDDWMEGSVVEIVRNLREAPLFVHVYDQDRGGRGRGQGWRVDEVEDGEEGEGGYLRAGLLFAQDLRGRVGLRGVQHPFLLDEGEEFPRIGEIAAQEFLVVAGSAEGPKS